MEIIDTYIEIISLLERMDGEFDIALWEKYITNISVELYEKIRADSSKYDFHQDILPVLNQVIREREKLEIVHNSFLHHVNIDLNNKVRQITGSNLQVRIIFYMGLCNGAGWATTLDEEPAILLGVEKMIELDWCDAETITSLIYHELGHIWHTSVGKINQKTTSTRGKYILQLYQEGIAGYFEQLLSNDFTKYHQNKGNWLSWCYENKRDLNIEYLRRLQENESAQDFFGDWCTYQGFSNVGYFIGCEFIKHLASKHSLNELANLDICTIYDEFIKYSA